MTLVDQIDKQSSERRFFLALTVKNEAPSIWEWVAYHRSIGFTDIAIYQNDSEDGTQKLLRTMAKAGFIQYFPNPSREKGWQNKAYRRASRLPEYKAAEWAISLDSDEFLVVKVGDGKVSDLVDALPPEVNACTIHWKAFGSSYHLVTPEGLVTEEFTLTERPERIALRKMGFKSIFKPSGYRRIGVHKPKDAFPEVPSVMCNGSGILLDPDTDPGWRSKDAGLRSLAQVNHYAIRDLERFLVKSGRGRAANHQRPVDKEYWDTFNYNDVEDSRAALLASSTKAEMKRMDEKARGRLAVLTDRGYKASHAVFRDLMQDENYSSIYNEISSGFPKSKPAGPTKVLPRKMMEQLKYDEIIVTNGIKIPFVPKIITPPIELPMRKNRYETGECRALLELIQEGDTVLELGAGVGLLSTVAALSRGVKSVVAVEANPEIIPIIKETHRLNGVQNVTLMNGVASSTTTDAVDFYLRQDFWASSMEPDSRPYLRSIKVPVCNVKELVERHRPSVIACDIEGGELGLFDNVDLSSVRVIIIEFHPKVYGQETVDAITRLFTNNGFAVVPVERPTTVRRFIRSGATAADQSWPPYDPSFLVTTCMKDEGPFILEWIAWHKSIGIDRMVVFTNDCTDGTNLILDRLEELGLLRHMPNPAISTGSTQFQLAALAYTPYLSEWRKADFYISMDVDEFINIRCGEGKLSDLLAATPPFDALSMSELNHGSNGNLHFEPGLLTKQFPRHETERPGSHKSQRGVKTITRISKKLERPRNHRPDFLAQEESVKWLDGSGQSIATLNEDPALNGLDVRGRYDLVVLDHFALRSLDSYLIKMHRGDVVMKNKSVSQRYWRLRNKNDEVTSNFDRQQPRFRSELDKLYADPTLKALHDRACDIHVNRASELLKESEYSERKDWIMENCWEVT